MIITLATSQNTFKKTLISHLHGPPSPFPFSPSALFHLPIPHPCCPFSLPAQRVVFFISTVDSCHTRVLPRASAPVLLQKKRERERERNPVLTICSTVLKMICFCSVVVADLLVLQLVGCTSLAGDDEVHEAWIEARHLQDLPQFDVRRTSMFVCIIL